MHTAGSKPFRWPKEKLYINKTGDRPGFFAAGAVEEMG